MSRAFLRTAKNYDGTHPTTHSMASLLPKVLSGIDKTYQVRGDLILAAWPEVVGPRLAGMTKALSYQEGVLNISVSNSTLYSLLHQHEKKRLLDLLRKKFPHTEIKTITFRVG